MIENRLFHKVRINVTTGTAAYEPPTLEFYDGDRWMAVYTGGNDGDGWYENIAGIAFKSEQLEENPDLQTWIANNSYQYQ